MRPRLGLGKAVSVVVVIATALAVLAAAIAAEGYETPELELHDAGVWVSWSDRGRVGRDNTQISQIDTMTAVGGETDLLQSGEYVFVHNEVGDELTPIDGRTGATTDQTARLPDKATVGLGGSGSGVVPTLAVLKDDGDLWVAPAPALLGQSLTSDESGDQPMEPTRSIAGATDLAVGLDGIARVFVPKQGVVEAFDSSGAETGSTGVSSAAETNDFDLTTVGSVPVVLDHTSQVLLLPGGTRVRLAKYGAGAQLQQPGPTNDEVLVATDERALGISLDSGEVRVLTDAGTGKAAAPVYVAGCAWMAWSGDPTVAGSCEGDERADVHELGGLTAGKALRFRVNRDKVVLNEIETGKTFLLGEGEPKDSSWTDAEIPDTDTQDAEQSTTAQRPKVEEEQQPPDAVDDTGDERFATRIGRTVVVDVMRNDSDPNGDVMVVERVADVTPPTALVEIVSGGLAVQVTPRDLANTPIEFTYTINDGHGSKPDSARARVDVHDVTQNVPPECTDGEPQETYARAGRSVNHNVLSTARDGDGDTVVLVTPVRPESPEGTSTDGTTTSDERGNVEYRPPGVGFAGDVRIPYQITDGQGALVPCELLVHVKAEDDAENDPPTAGPDHAVVVAGREVVIGVLANDSDPDGDALRVVGVDPSLGASIDIDDRQRVHVVAATPGPLNLGYQITDGPSEPQRGLLRVDVLPADGQHPPVAVRDDVVLPPDEPAVVDVLANDADVDGDVLVVVEAVAPPELAVELVHRQFLRISPSNGGLLSAPVTFQYTVTDGTTPSFGTVVVQPGAVTSQNQPPDARDDDVSVRAGSIAAFPLLANDVDPEGGRLSVGYDDAAQTEQAKGLAFPQGDLLRFRAPKEQGTFQLAYRAVDPAGYADSAFVTVHVLPPDAANRAPAPPEVAARAISGEPTTIDIPVATMDPDADAVVLLGIGDLAPKHGSIVAVAPDRLTYLPDWDDRNGDGIPEGFFGTDTFTYRVRDALGAEAVGTVRIGVAAPPTVNSRPVAIDDARRVGAGGKLVVDVVRNDSDANDDDLFLDADAGLGVPPDAGFSAKIRDDGRIEFDAGSLEQDDEAAITYTVTDGILIDVGVLRVAITNDANLLPIAADDNFKTTSPGQRISVPVIANDFDPDGERADLRVVEVDEPGRPSRDRRSVNLTMPDRAVEIVYTVEDAAGGQSRAVLRVPVADQERRRPVATYDSATLKPGDLGSVDVLANDTSSPGFDKVLFDVADPRNGVCAVEGGEVTFAPAPDFVGRGGCSYLMGDGRGDDPKTLRATGMVGVEVRRDGNTPPTFIEQPLTLDAGSEITRDMKYGVRDPDGGDAQHPEFGDVAVEGPGVTASFEGSELTIRAAASARSSEATITFPVRDPHGDETTGRVMVTVRGGQETGGTRSGEEDAGHLAVVVPDRAETDQNVPVNIRVLANDQPAGNDRPLRISAVSPSAGGTTTTIAGDTEIRFSPTGNFHGETTFTYTVDDGTGDAARLVTGTVTVNVVGRPDRPPAPAVVRESKAISLSWGVPAPNGAPITQYWVKASGGPISGEAIRKTAANTLRFDGLTNGARYTFQIAAVNTAVTRALEAGAIPDVEYSLPSVEIEPNEKPPTPSAPIASYTASDHNGGTLTVSWSDPLGDGTPVNKYLVEISPPPTGQRQVPIAGGGSKRETIGGLTNGVPYTFRVMAFNTIQGEEGKSEWSAWSNAETPAKPPDAPLTPTVSPGDKFIEVGWAAPGNSNGGEITAYVVEFARDGTVVGETGELPAGQLTVRVDTTNGAAYTFRVKAKNKAGFSPWSGSSSAAVSYGVPGGATGLTASEGDGSSVLTITGAPDQNGRPIDRWEYRAATGGAGFPNDTTGWTGFGGSGTAVPAQNGVDHIFQVRGCNIAGCATSPGQTSNTARPYGVPLAPNVSGSVNGQTINWQWSSTGDNGRPITGWEWSEDGGGWNAVGAGTTSISRSYGYSQTVTFRVRALNARGPGADGQAQRTTQPPPQSVTVSKGPSGTWDPPGTDEDCTSSGCALLHIDWSGFGGGSHTVQCRTANNNATFYTQTVSGSSGSQNLFCYADASVWGGVYVVMDGVRSDNTATW